MSYFLTNYKIRTNRC